MNNKNDTLIGTVAGKYFPTKKDHSNFIEQSLNKKTIESCI